MRVTVKNNNVDQAIRQLRRKLQKEGVLRQIREDARYVKPSDKRRLKQAAAVRREKKAALKREQAFWGA